MQDTLVKVKASKSKKKKETADGRDGRRRKNPDTEGDFSAKKQKAEKKDSDTTGGDSMEVSQGSWKGSGTSDPTADSRSKLLHFVPQINPNIRFATYTKENGRTLVVQDQPVADGTAFPSFSVIASQTSLRSESVRSGSKGDNVESTTEAVTSAGVTPTTVRISDVLSNVTTEENDKSGWAIGEVIWCIVFYGGVHY